MFSLAKAEGYHMLHRLDFCAVSIVASIMTVLGAMFFFMMDISFDGWKANFMGDVFRSGSFIIVIYVGFVSAYIMSDYFRYSLLNSEIITSNKMYRICGVHALMVAMLIAIVFCFIVSIISIIYKMITGEQACDCFIEKMILLFFIIFRMGFVGVLHVFLFRNVFIAILLYLINQVMTIGLIFNVIELFTTGKMIVFTSLDQLKVLFQTMTFGENLKEIFLGTVIEVMIMGILLYICYLWKGKRLYE